MSPRSKSLLAIAAALMLLRPGAAAGDAVGDFYRGKTLTVVVGYAPGGGFDHFARLVAQYLPKYLPGRPNAILENKPGAASVVATRQILKLAPKDGTVIGIPNHNLFFDQVLGLQRFDFDMTEFQWLGRLGTRLSVGIVDAASGVKDLAGLRTAKDQVWAAAGTTGGAVIIPAVLNRMFGTQIRTVTGYSGQAEMYLSFERGETTGMATAVWEDLAPGGAQAKWLREGRANVLYVVASERHPDLPEVPALPDLGATPEQRQMLELLTAADVIGRAFYVAPGVPPERVSALRAAFDAAVQDPELLADARKRNVEINAMPGVKLGAYLRQVAATPQPVLDALREAVQKPQ